MLSRLEGFVFTYSRQINLTSFLLPPALVFYFTSLINVFVAIALQLVIVGVISISVCQKLGITPVQFEHYREDFAAIKEKRTAIFSISAVISGFLVSLILCRVDILNYI